MTKNSNKKTVANVACLKTLGLYNIRGQLWFAPNRLKKNAIELAKQKVTKLTKFCLQTRT
jgi:hypothetical protein